MSHPTVVVPFTTKIEVTGEMIEAILEMAGYGCNYWALSIDDDQDKQEITIIVDPDVTADEDPYVVTYQELAEAMADIAGGGGPQVREDLVDHIRKALFDRDPGEIDSEAADVIIQIAALNDLVYG